MSSVQKNLENIQKLIDAYAQKYGRGKNSVKLLAVGKHQPVEKILAALRAGQRAFGENYLQEALPKIAAVSEVQPEGVEWHFIGPVQSNKTHKIAEHFAWVHSVASEKIAKRLSEQRPAHMPPLNICIEVNISHEATKSGVGPEQVLPLVKYCLTLPRLKLRGLMAIPAANTDFTAERREFHKLFSLSQHVINQGCPLDTLSMGMSEDFEAAIAEGSTIVRIGTAIFGPREGTKQL